MKPTQADRARSSSSRTDNEADEIFYRGEICPTIPARLEHRGRRTEEEYGLVCRSSWKTRRWRHTPGGSRARGVRSRRYARPRLCRGLEGQLTWGIHVSLAPTWFDPAETPGIITPFMVLYALHDGMVKPMPGQPLAPSLAESWSGSEDGLAYDFLVRKDAKFHRGMALWPVGKRAIEKTRRRIVTLYTAHR